MDPSPSRTVAPERVDTVRPNDLSPANPTWGAMRHLAWAILVVALLAGCLSASPSATDDLDPDAGDGAGSAVLHDLPGELSGLESAASLGLNGSGAGLWIDEANHTLYASRLGGGLSILDVRDPQAPVEVGWISSPPDDADFDSLYARDVDIMHREDRTLALLAGGGQGIHVVDVTDPTAPEHVLTADRYGSHNLAVVPGTPYVYDSTGTGLYGKVAQPAIPVLDLSDLDDPQWTTIPIPNLVNDQPTQSDGCHDIVVRPDLDRAYCAGGGTMYAQGGGESFIWDISEPLDPDWLGVVDNPFIVYHHQAIPSEDGDILLINDEYIAPNCNTGPTGTVKQPTAAAWVYDISDPANPKMQGYVQADNTMLPSAEVPPGLPNCGSHFGDIVDGRQAATWGWYSGGTLLIDFSDPTEPTIVDRHADGPGIWEAKYHNGHAFSNGGGVVQALELV